MYLTLWLLQLHHLSKISMVRYRTSGGWWSISDIKNISSVTWGVKIYQGVTFLKSLSLKDCLLWSFNCCHHSSWYNSEIRKSKQTGEHFSPSFLPQQALQGLTNISWWGEAVMNNLYYTTMYEGKLYAHDLQMCDLKVKIIIYCGYLGYIVSACTPWS